MGDVSTLTGRKIRKYSGSTRPEGIDPYIWSHFASAKERKEARELYEAELKAKGEAGKDGVLGNDPFKGEREERRPIPDNPLLRR